MTNNPFSYSHSRHKRKFSPAHSNDYSKYKPTLRLEYDRKCIYCLFPDKIKGYNEFGVDHYRPKSRFPHLETVYDNLFYCCNNCNRRKSNRWSDTIFVPNPDEHVMIEHLRFKNEIVEPISNAGKYAAELLQLNAPSLVRIRQTLLTSMRALEKQMQDFEKLEKAIKKAFNKGQISQAERDTDLLEVEKDRKITQSALDDIAGRD